MAPHDWTGEGMRYADLRAIRPPIHRFESEFQQNLSTLCEEVPLDKQAEMKRSYYRSAPLRYNVPLRDCLSDNHMSCSCIQYVDHLVGQLVGALKTNNLYEVSSKHLSRGKDGA